MVACAAVTFLSSKKPFHTAKSLVQSHIPIQAAVRVRWKGTSGALRRILTTLDPSKLNSNDFMDLSNRVRPRIRTPMGGTDEPSFRSLRFPSDSTGFLYYRVPPPHHPPIMGGVRFRVTGSADPSSFHSGSDLLDPETTLPWDIPLLMLAKNKKHGVLRDLLLADGLVSEELMERCDRLWQTYPWPKAKWRTILYYLEQPFFVRFNSQSINIWTVLKDRFNVSFIRVGRGTFKMQHAQVELKGSAIVRFEPSGQEANSLVIRVLKIVEPLGEERDRDRGASICIAAEGELLQRQTPCRRHPRTLLIDTDRRVREGLKALLPSSQQTNRFVN